MKVRTLIMIALVLTLTMAFGATAWADTVSGTGTMTAHGTGVAWIQGDGVVDISLHGAGTVWISGADILEVRGEGYRHDFERGVLLVGWKGDVHAAGRDLRIQMTGGVIDFTATGKGVVYLKGDGYYKLGDREGRWPLRGHRFPLGTREPATETGE
ncbi:MAG: hypothetical protein Kow0047_16070 [Anaerolineae bacterium]